MRLVVLGSFFIVLSMSHAEPPSHVNSSGKNRSTNQRVMDGVNFKSTKSYSIGPNEKVVVEQGTVGKQKAVWFHQEPQGNGKGTLDVIAMQAGKAKNLELAKKICNELVPPGKWRLPSGKLILFALNVGNPENLISEISNPEMPDKKIYNFWLEHPKGFTPDSKDTYYTLGDAQGVEATAMIYHRMINEIRQRLDTEANPLVKQAKQKILEQYQEGIPVVCVTGSEAW